MENKKFFGYKAAIGAFLVIFCNLGAASTLGVFLPSMSEYTGWSVAVLGYNGTFNTIGNVLMSLICVKALSKLGPKKLMFISIIGIFLNFQFYTFATDGQNVTSLVFIYLAGLMASFAIVFGTHAVCTYVISQWFVGEKRGKVISTVLSGASFGAAAWVFVAGQMFRVMNYKMCYQILSWVLLAVGMLSVIFLIRDPEKMGQKPIGTEVSDEVDVAQLPGVTRAEAIRSPSFWFFAIALLLGGCEGSAWLVYSPTWWTMNGLTPTEASNWNAIYTVLAGFVMLGVGSAFSKVGPTVFSVIVCIAFSLCMVFLMFKKPMKKVLTEKYGEAYAAEIMKNSKKVYRELVEKADDIGDDNPMAYNELFALAFVAPYVASEKKIPPETVQEMMRRSLYHIKWCFARTGLNTEKGKAENKKSVIKYAKWYTPEKEAKYPTSFKVDFVGQPYDGSCYYRITRCPICIYTEKLGVPELMPLFCELDEVMITLQHGVLHRKQTLADGGEYCDYFITGNKE